jgi:hypothetical protein
MSLGGYPSLICFSNLACSSFEKTCWQFIPNHLKLRYRTQAILSESESMITELDLDVDTKHDQNLLSSRTKVLEGQLHKFEVEFISVEST